MKKFLKQFSGYLGGVCLIFFMVACSASRTTVTQPAKTLMLKSYFLKRIQIGRTYGDSSDLSKKLAVVEERARAAFSERGYVSSLHQNADGIVSISVLAEADDGTSPDELRFMKGAHGSRFPSANPRIRDIESDHLKIKIVSGIDGHLIYEARCRLFLEASQAVAAEVIDLDSVSQCLQAVLEPLHSAR